MPTKQQLCNYWQRLREVLLPYSDVIIFMVTLFVTNICWKMSVTGESSDRVVWWFGCVNISAPFEAVSRHVAACVYWLVDLVRDTVHLSEDGHTVWFDSGSATSIVWSCSAIKQLFIWLMLMLTVRGGWKQKLWFIPFGWVCCYGFNILRITIITLFIEFHPSWFDFLHGFLFKYMFYGMMFALWVWFVERIRPALTAAKEAK